MIIHYSLLATYQNSIKWGVLYVVYKTFSRQIVFTLDEVRHFRGHFFSAVAVCGAGSEKRGGGVGLLGGRGRLFPLANGRWGREKVRGGLQVAGSSNRSNRQRGCIVSFGGRKRGGFVGPEVSVPL